MPVPTVGRAPGAAPGWIVAADLLAKTLLLLAVARVAIDPGWGNLEGKAPGTRAVTYPMLALLVPVLHLALGRTRPYPWGADLLVTLPAFSDVLGNRLDLYDRVVWFDDAMHVAATCALSAGVLVLSGAARLPLDRRLQLSVAAGLTMSLAWELWEYVAFVTRSGEAATAYVDTLGDLALGWLGAVLAALLLAVPGRSGRPVERTRAPRRRDLWPCTPAPPEGHRGGRT
ncbi:hypothetical protein IEZ26_21835 [Nocardioides cavernae]|uniref:DUF2238 domain-containing protein n=1 Tax=Nocardioides cavernae TaxID=1921566 RepID=A0ABR8NGM3_9ACTN|nr:hypothetical protein [Nocardioides cavernae]MBD3927278.1 hypothetical protein [Nocardioides cavernae]MBM7513119.1 hypothetical protein [Nocardioides cavernae]